MATASAGYLVGCGQSRCSVRLTPKLDILRLTTRGLARSRRAGSTSKRISSRRALRRRLVRRTVSCQFLSGSVDAIGSRRSGGYRDRGGVCPGVAQHGHRIHKMNSALSPCSPKTATDAGEAVSCVPPAVFTARRVERPFIGGPLQSSYSNCAQNAASWSAGMPITVSRNSSSPTVPWCAPGLT
jgi:hypothetical protein